MIASSTGANTGFLARSCQAIGMRMLKRLTPAGMASLVGTAPTGLAFLGIVPTFHTPHWNG